MVKKYIEIGLGNRWFARTEYEREDGTEFERRGMDFPNKFESVYLRIWMGKRVLIWDSKEGMRLLLNPVVN
ncbi:DUF3977 family protein [Paenibacillus sp. H1-7]|nr:DUF3977 family protein [Paenibacillus sp. H1-7]